MKRWTNAVVGAVAVWLVWDALRCPGCRAERERIGALKARERHEKRHGPKVPAARADLKAELEALGIAPCRACGSEYSSEAHRAKCCGPRGPLSSDGPAGSGATPTGAGHIAAAEARRPRRWAGRNGNLPKR